MTKDFDSTPSFYNNEDAFKKYLKQTSFYMDLQNYLIKLIKFSKSKNILELGSATGDTSIKVAKHFPECHVHGIDIRENIIEVATKSASKQNIKNISFSVNDMVKFVKNNLDYDFVYMLYAFHHIEDPLKNKVNFLTDLYNNLKKGSFVCIAEAFIPENAKDLHDEKTILDAWNFRKLEAQSSVFWNSLSGLSENNISFAKEISYYSQDKEFEAGRLVSHRNNEYLIKESWLKNTIEKIGFKIVVSNHVNSVLDKIILLQK